MSLRDELQTIYDQHGVLTPELVRDTARPKNHPLHSRVFDRAPKDAAEAWYLERAHELIRTVKVVYRDATDTDPERSIRYWHAVRTPSDRNEFVYEPADKVAADPFTRQLVLRDMERRWRTLFYQYKAFEEFAELVRGDLEAVPG